MQVTELCAYVSGTKTVKLWDINRNELAQAIVIGDASNSNWACTAVTPVSVTAGTYYYVGVCLQGSGAYYRTNAGIPKTCNNVYIERVFSYPTSGCTLGGVSSPVVDNMFGMADIGVT